MLLNPFIIFPSRYTFKQHNKSHEGEKCFKCELCPYASTSARHLESHMLVHTEQKPYQCDQCDQVPHTVGISPLCFWLMVRYLFTYCICKLIDWNSSRWSWEFDITHFYAKLHMTFYKKYTYSPWEGWFCVPHYLVSHGQEKSGFIVRELYPLPQTILFFLPPRSPMDGWTTPR